MFTLKMARSILASTGLLALAACGGGGGGTTPPPVTTTYTIGGTASGVAGTGMVLQLNGAGNLAVSANGAFTFAGPVNSGAAYTVTVLTQPSAPTQSCVVANGTGTATANVTNVTVTCTTSNFTVGGTVTGLVGSITIRNTSGIVLNNLTPAADGPFTFPTQASGTAYAVTVVAHPTGPAQTCTVTNGTGTVGAANVTNVAIVCSTNTYAVSGTIVGLTGTGLVLHNSTGTNATPAAGAGTFSFAAQADGSAYAITVTTQPTSPTQVCAVTGGGSGTGTGTIAGAAVTNVVVTCTTSAFTVGGNVSGLLTGNSVVLRNNGGNNLTVAANGAFTFTTPVNSGATYAVTVLTNPASPAQTCTPTSASGTVTTAAITSVVVTCVNNDTTAPTVSSKTPIDTTVGTALDTKVVANFSEAVNPSTVTAATFTLTGPAGAVTGTVALSGGNQIATFTPTSPATLAFNTTYTATLTTAVKDPTGNALAANVVWTFNTGHRVAGGGYHTCARQAGTNNGNVKCWGSASYGQLGTEDVFPVGDAFGDMALLTPINLGTGLSAVDIAAGENFSCARLIVTLTGANGGVKCWGRNTEGQLGQNDFNNRGKASGEMGDNLTAISLGVATPVEIVAGGQHVCARLDDGSVKCWGNNSNGTIGQGTATASYATPQTVSLGTGLKAVALYANNGYHTCARLVNGAGVAAGLKCWGDNTYGQLGLGDANSRGDAGGEMGDALPALNLGLGVGVSITQVVATSGHSCALLSNSTVKCWGNNWFGQLGTETSNGGTNCVQNDACIGDVVGEVGAGIPLVNLQGTGTIVELAGGDRQTCARFSNGDVKCWGWNGYGQLGKGDTVTRGDSVGSMGNFAAVPLGTFTAVEVDAGGFHECAVSDAGAVKCWGYNQTQIPSPGSTQGGQLGQDDTSNRGDNAGEMGALLLPVVGL